MIRVDHTYPNLIQINYLFIIKLPELFTIVLVFEKNIHRKEYSKKVKIESENRSFFLLRLIPVL